LFLLLALTFVRGVLYLAVVPPWQHYDEPTHFEYAQLIAERRRIPQAGDYDLEMRREIAASMEAANFWGAAADVVVDFWSDRPPWIGVAEFSHPPFYYALLALPQLLVTQQDVETQLYLARLASVLLFVLTVAAAYGLVSEAFPRRRWLPLAVATFVALVPPFTDLMSAVNNDVGAAAAVTLLLWAAVRLIRRGASLGRISMLFILVAVCAATKSTAGLVAVATLLALGVSLIPRARRRWLWIGLAVLTPFALVATFTWGEQAAYWYSDAPSATANRAMAPTPVGRYAFALSSGSDPGARILFQELERSDGQSLQGHTVTLGAWLRVAEGPDVAVTLRLRDGLTNYSEQVKATSEWQFHAFTATVGADAPALAAYVVVPQAKEGAQTIYVDGIVLVDGEMPVAQAPHFETSQATGGEWGSQPFANLLRNSSAEKTWPGIRNWLENVRMYQKPISMVFHSVLDWSRTGWTYVPVMSNLFQGFWGRFGWNQLGLPPAYFFPLGLLTMASVAGMGIGLARRLNADAKHEHWQWRAWAVLGIAALVGWGATIMRIHPVIITRHVIWPTARYASVVIAPTAAALCLGLASLVPRRWAKAAALAGLAGLAALAALVTLDTLALLTVILPFYYG
jgi:4-amino-4-deoxy-L-arabinose transferase-like glycosyltransferase